MQRLAEGQDERLGRGVRGEGRQRLDGGETGDVEDRATTPFDHPADEGAGEVVQRVDVDLDHLALLGLVGLREETRTAEAGVVAHAGEVEVQVLDGIDEPLARGDVGEVRGQDVGTDAMGAREFVGERVEPVDATGDEHDVVLLGGELAGELRADAGGGAGDEDRGCGVGLGQTHGRDDRWCARVRIGD